MMQRALPSLISFLLLHKWALAVTQLNANIYNGDWRALNIYLSIQPIFQQDLVQREREKKRAAACGALQHIERKGKEESAGW